MKLVDTLISCDKNNFQIVYQIGNSSNHTIKFPDPIVKLNDDEVADMVYTFEKYSDSTNRFLPFSYEIALMPMRNIVFYYLPSRRKLEKREFISCPYMDKGLFRMRLKLLLSKYNKGLKDIYSNWVTFKIISSGRPL